MNERGRNISVGLTVIIALCMLGTMIVIFTGVPEMLKRTYNTKILFNSTHDAKKGDAVRLAGMRIGSITGVVFTDDDPRKGVTFTVAIDRDVRVPGNVSAYIHSQGIVGSAYIELKPDGEYIKHHITGEELEFMPTDRVTVIKGSELGPGGVIPSEITEAVKDMREGFKDFLRTTEKFERTLDELNKIVGDKENQAHFKALLAHFNEASKEAAEAMAAMRGFTEEAKVAVKDFAGTTTTVGERFERLTNKLIDNSEKISDLMATLNRGMTKMESGKGTAGRLLNDPKLYNNLAESTEQLSKLLIELRELVKAWKADGLGVNLK